MNKSIYLAAFAALALTACSSDSNDIFDQSAAERLEQYKNEYADVLTADGGLWTMEYFSNEEEPGYLFVMKFSTDGSVKIAANHKWINNTYQEETSLWTMIADNGPVLSFNSYNTLFHIFSDPANITGPDAPKGENNDDINETGYGHDGDYEFQVMEVSEDGNTVRLLGKKRLIDIYLRRLDPSTDMQEYMQEYKDLESTLFVKEIPNILLKDSDGETYVVTNAHTGVMSVYPQNGDPVDQTRSANFIITKSCIRFMQPFEIVNANGDEKEIQEFKFVGNHSLVNVEDEAAVMNAGSFCEFIYNNNRNWKVDLNSFEGTLKDEFNAFVDQLRSLYNYKSANVTDMTFEYNVAKETYLLKFSIRTSSKGSETDRYISSFSNAEGGVKITIGEGFDDGSVLALNAYSELQNLLNSLTYSIATYSVRSDCGPSVVTLSVGGGSMTMNAL